METLQDSGTDHRDLEPSRDCHSKMVKEAGIYMLIADDEPKTELMVLISGCYQLISVDWESG